MKQKLINLYNRLNPYKQNKALRRTVAVLNAQLQYTAYISQFNAVSYLTVANTKGEVVSVKIPALKYIDMKKAGVLEIKK